MVFLELCQLDLKKVVILANQNTCASESRSTDERLYERYELQIIPSIPALRNYVRYFADGYPGLIFQEKPDAFLNNQQELVNTLSDRS